jgi:hypothetical protein
MSCANVHQQRTCDNVELMEVPITQFRREIFDLANRALEGETITVAYKGKRLRIVPEVESATSLDKVTKLNFLAPGYSGVIDDEADAKMKAEMQAEWEADWAEI